MKPLKITMIEEVTEPHEILRDKSFVDPFYKLLGAIIKQGVKDLKTGRDEYGQKIDRGLAVEELRFLVPESLRPRMKAVYGIEL